VDAAKPKRVRAIKLEMPLRLVGPKHGRKNWLITIITASWRRERGPASTNKKRKGRPPIADTAGNVTVTVAIRASPVRGRILRSAHSE
jgi:hypothetical protein